MAFANREINSQVLTHSFSQGELMDFYWGLRTEGFDHAQIVALVRDEIEDIHRASVLKVALKKAFELKKKRQPPHVPFGCSNFHCPSHNTNVLHATLVPNRLCEMCNSNSDYSFDWFTHCEYR